MAFALAPASRTRVVSDAAPIAAFGPKDPDDVLNYVWSLGDWLDVEGTTLASYTASIDGAPVALVQDSHASDADPDADPDPLPGRNVCVWVSGGTDGVDYFLRLQAVTAAGHTLERSCRLPVRSR
jgi:hypothetical protein